MRLLLSVIGLLTILSGFPLAGLLLILIVLMFVED